MLGTYTVAVVRQPSEDLAAHLRAVGDLIRRGRKAKKMSQDTLAEAIGVSRKTMGLVEQGERPLNQEEIYVLADTLGMKLRAFYEPPPATRLVSEPLDDYLTDFAAGAAAEAVEKDRRQRERRGPRKPPPSQP